MVIVLLLILSVAYLSVMNLPHPPHSCGASPAVFLYSVLASILMSTEAENNKSSALHYIDVMNYYAI
jgi:hypothetical protein